MDQFPLEHSTKTIPKLNYIGISIVYNTIYMGLSLRREIVNLNCLSLVTVRFRDFFSSIKRQIKYLEYVTGKMVYRLDASHIHIRFRKSLECYLVKSYMCC